jgi:hypothetical protein
LLRIRAGLAKHHGLALLLRGEREGTKCRPPGAAIPSRRVRSRGKNTDHDYVVINHNFLVRRSPLRRPPQRKQWETHCFFKTHRAPPQRRERCVALIPLPAMSSHDEKLEKNPFNDKESQIAERKTVSEQARARGRREPGPKPRSHIGPVRKIAVVVRRHRAQPSTSQ